MGVLSLIITTGNYLYQPVDDSDPLSLKRYTLQECKQDRFKVSRFPGLAFNFELEILKGFLDRKLTFDML